MFLQLAAMSDSSLIVSQRSSSPVAVDQWGSFNMQTTITNCFKFTSCVAAYLLVIFDDKGSDVVTLQLKTTVVKLLVEQCFHEYLRSEVTDKI